jgi:hypothetical protein
MSLLNGYQPPKLRVNLNYSSSFSFEGYNLMTPAQRKHYRLCSKLYNGEGSLGYVPQPDRRDFSLG